MVELHPGRRTRQYKDDYNLKLREFHLLFCLRLLRLGVWTNCPERGGLAAFSESTGALVMLVAGLIATIVATVIVTKVTMRALSDVIDDGDVV